MTPPASEPLRRAPNRLPRPDDPDPVPFGRYRGAFGSVDTSTWDQAWGGFRRRLERKAWLYVGAYSEDVLAGLAIVDAGYLGMAWAYWHDRRTGRTEEARAALPRGFPADHQPRLHEDWRLPTRRGEWSVRVTSRGWRATALKRSFALTVDVDRAGEALSALCPAGGRPFHLTTKYAGLPARVSIGLEGREAPTDALGVLDFSKGYPPRRTRWNWASLVGRLANGERFGVNLVSGFNDGLENALWVGDAPVPVPLGEAVFEYDTEAAAETPWRVRTEDGVVDVTFTPEGARREDLALRVVESRFVQPFGRFEGTLRVGGREERVQGFGVVEEHEALW